MPTVIINAEICKGCELCVEACPRKIIVIGTTPNGQGYFTAVYEDASKKCTGCALCAEMCPDIAIEVFK
jgi:2-oxoglutarate ferredoxin oxidoreductase subunit delta